MNTSESITNIMGAISATQMDVGIVGRDSEGYGYNYTSYPHWCSKTRPVMGGNGLTFVHGMDNINGEPALGTILYHQSGEYISTVFPLAKAGISKANDAQQMGAAVSYARRYNESALLGIPSGDKDDDAACLTRQPSSQEEAKPAAPTTPIKPIPDHYLAKLDACESLDDLKAACAEVKQEAIRDRWAPALNKFFRDREATFEAMTKEVFGTDSKGAA